MNLCVPPWFKLFSQPQGTRRRTGERQSLFTETHGDTRPCRNARTGLRRLFARHTAADGVEVETGVFSGFAPAWQASKLDPVVALRYE